MVGFNVLIEERESERNEDGLVEYLSEFLGGGVGGLTAHWLLHNKEEGCESDHNIF